MSTVEQVRRRGATRRVTVTSTVDGRDHLIREPIAAVGTAIGYGESVALCGRRVVAAPLVVPPGPTCIDCETALHRITTGGTGSRRSRGVPAQLVRRRWRRSASRSTTTGRHRVGRA